METKEESKQLISVDKSGDESPKDKCGGWFNEWNTDNERFENMCSITSWSCFLIDKVREQERQKAERFKKKVKTEHNQKFIGEIWEEIYDEKLK